MMNATDLDKYVSKKSSVAVATIIALSTVAARTEGNPYILAAMMTAVAIT